MTDAVIDFRPAPAAAPWRARVLAHAGLELGIMLRNGEQLLLTVVIPLGLLLGLGLTDVVDLGTGSDPVARWALVVPGVMALAMLSTAFTGLAIQTGFERRYGVLKRLGATPLGRTGLLTGKAAAVLAVELAQLLVIGAVALALGWRPAPGVSGVLGVAGFVVVGTWALAALGLLLAGIMRAEATLAAANLVFLVLLVGGGLFDQGNRVSGWPGALLELLPTAALADGLRAAWAGLPVAGSDWATLVAWAVLGSIAVARTFRWD